LIDQAVEAIEFARKNTNGRQADRRLANRRLQPLGHLTADGKYTLRKYLRISPFCLLEANFLGGFLKNRHLLHKPRTNNEFGKSLSCVRADRMGTVLGTGAAITALWGDEPTVGGDTTPPTGSPLIRPPTLQDGTTPAAIQPPSEPSLLLSA
jgi:hypothetical protein